MKNKLLLCRVDTKYINYLRKFQDHIWDNEDKGHTRPYIGIVLKINEYNYYVPLSSPKEKHVSMKDALDFIKVTHKGNLIGVININNIIPVDNSDITIIDTQKEEEKYKDLLNLEMIFIRKNTKRIINNAKSVYEKITRHKTENIVLAKRCYDFKLLETKMKEYQIFKKNDSQMEREVAMTDVNSKTHSEGLHNF